MTRGEKSFGFSFTLKSEFAWLRRNAFVGFFVFSLSPNVFLVSSPLPIKMQHYFVDDSIPKKVSSSLCLDIITHLLVFCSSYCTRDSTLVSCTSTVMAIYWGHLSLFFKIVSRASMFYHAIAEISQNRVVHHLL